MKVAIISDIHDNLANLHQCLDWCYKNKIESLICCGDITNSDTLKKIAKGFVGNIYLVRGNIDTWLDDEVEKYNNVEFFNKIGNFSLDNYQVGICHEPYLISRVLKKNSQIIFYGHTHKPWIEDRSGVKLVNPGALEGGHQKATFAYWDTRKGKLELKVLEHITNP